MSARVTTTLMRLPTTDEKVSVKACWAPSTSLLSRVTSAPVWVRVKKAMGMRCTWAKTRARMSKMRPSPMLADTHRFHSDSPASSTASCPSSRAMSTTTPELWRRMPASRTWR